MYSIKSSLDIIIYYTDIKIKYIVWLKCSKRLKYAQINLNY